MPRREGVRTPFAKHGPVRIFGFCLNVIGGLACIGAGAYLLVQQSESGPTWLEVIAHGSGVFFAGCGIFMIGSSFVAASDR